MPRKSLRWSAKPIIEYCYGFKSWEILYFVCEQCLTFRCDVCSRCKLACLGPHVSNPCLVGAHGETLECVGCVRNEVAAVRSSLNCDLIAATLLSRARYPTTLSCQWSLFAFCPLCSCVCLALCGSVSTPACGARLFRLCDCLWTVGVREHLIRERSPFVMCGDPCLELCIWAMRCIYPVAFSSRKRGPLTGTILLYSRFYVWVEKDILFKLGYNWFFEGISQCLWFKTAVASSRDVATSRGLNCVLILILREVW